MGEMQRCVHKFNQKTRLSGARISRILGARGGGWEEISRKFAQISRARADFADFARARGFRGFRGISRISRISRARVRNSRISRISQFRARARISRNSRNSRISRISGIRGICGIHEIHGIRGIVRGDTAREVLWKKRGGEFAILRNTEIHEI